MFSGIVTEVGTIEALDDGVLRVRGGASLGRTKPGGSIAVNGVCLTVALIDGHVFSADLMPETLRATGLGRLGPGSLVNLEPALGFGEEVGGHLVQGHVDGVGEVVDMSEEGNARWISVRVPPEVLEYCVLKGSIAIDGASLTIAALERDVIRVSLIPHTLQSTIAAGYRPGTIVNLEADVLAKYVARYLAQGRSNDDTQSTTMGRTGSSIDVTGGHPHTENQ